TDNQSAARHGRRRTEAAWPRYLPALFRDARAGTGRGGGVTPKQKAFIDEYLKVFNATQAAIRAGYSEASANNIGPENLVKSSIAAEIQRRVAERTMTTNEALIRLRERATFVFSPYIVYEDIQISVDVNRLIADGHGHMIRAVRQTRDGPLVDFTNPDDALTQIIKVLGLFNDPASGRENDPIYHVHKGYINVSPDDWDA